MRNTIVAVGLLVGLVVSEPCTAELRVSNITVHPETLFPQGEGGWIQYTEVVVNYYYDGGCCVNNNPTKDSPLWGMHVRYSDYWREHDVCTGANEGPAVEGGVAVAQCGPVRGGGQTWGEYAKQWMRDNGNGRARLQVPGHPERICVRIGGTVLAGGGNGGDEKCTKTVPPKPVGCSISAIPDAVFEAGAGDIRMKQTVRASLECNPAMSGTLRGDTGGIITLPWGQAEIAVNDHPLPVRLEGPADLNITVTVVGTAAGPGLYTRSAMLIWETD